MKKSSEWKSFEERVIRDARSREVVLFKMPESFKNVYSKAKTIQKKTPFDCFGSIDGRAIYFDCKTIQENKVLLSSTVFHKKKIHQWTNLKYCKELGGIAGYLIYFYMEERICWLSVDKVVEKVKLGEKSIYPSEMPSQAGNQLIDLRGLLSER